MNTMVLRIADFLNKTAPFSFLTYDNCVEVAASITVVYFEKGESIFEIHKPIHEVFYLVKEGAVGLYSQNNQLSDECDEGDIFGLRALIRQDAYQMSAKAIEETILYTIPASIYHKLISQNHKASHFIIQSFANNRIEISNDSTFYSNSKESIIEEETTAKYSKNPVCCSEYTRIETAAQIMTAKRVGSIVVVHKNKPIGIITDKDLRTKVATGRFAIHEEVVQIMSSPVLCYPETLTVAEAQIAMMKHKITHLCITKDGTDQSEVVGILSEHDIVLIRENNPSVLIKEIKRSYDVEKLVDIRRRLNKLLERYLQQGVSIEFIAKIVSEIHNALTQRAIDLSLEELNATPPTSFAWITLGSQGRKEQILLTDQDNAIVFGDSGDRNLNRTYFIQLAKKVTEKLNAIGFDYCPAEMMASNPKWCLSVEEWKKQYERWIMTPTEENVMFCTIFFDSQSLYGDSELTEQLMSFIDQSLEKSPVFLKFLGKNALQNPAPLGFFRQFLVEQSGEHRDHFDIKARAMMPLVDAARTLSLQDRIDAKNTLERYQELIQKEPQNKEVFKHAFEAFKTLLQFRTQQGFEHHSSGRFINLSQLTKLEKLALKDCFKAIKEVQMLLQTRLQLSNFL